MESNYCEGIRPFENLNYNQSEENLEVYYQFLALKDEVVTWKEQLEHHEYDSNLYNPCPELEKLMNELKKFLIK